MRITRLPLWTKCIFTGLQTFYLFQLLYSILFILFVYFIIWSRNIHKMTMNVLTYKSSIQLKFCAEWIASMRFLNNLENIGLQLCGDKHHTIPRSWSDCSGSTNNHYRHINICLKYCGYPLLPLLYGYQPAYKMNKRCRGWHTFLNSDYCHHKGINLSTWLILSSEVSMFAVTSILSSILPSRIHCKSSTTIVTCIIYGR